MEFPLDLVWFKLPWLGLQESFFFFLFSVAWPRMFISFLWSKALSEGLFSLVIPNLPSLPVCCWME